MVYNISNLVSQINLGAKRRLRFIKVDFSEISLNIIKILYNQGVIRTYIIKHNKILIFFKYYLKKIAMKITIISKPGNRIFMSIKKLSYYYNNNNFSGFLIIATQKGLITSTTCLLKEHIAGEVLLKIEL
jgi:ribosomal protein S8